MSETLSLSAVGRLLGRLLVREIDERMVADLSPREVEDSLRVPGLEVASLGPENLDELAVD